MCPLPTHPPTPGTLRVRFHPRPCLCGTQILEHNPKLFFHLQQQRLVELIRAGDSDCALMFAQEYLAPLGEENTEFLEELERTVALLAFDDASKSPVADLLESGRRHLAASELNAAILTAQCQEKEPKLPNLLRQLVWAQGRLEADGGTTTPFEFE